MQDPTTIETFLVDADAGQFRGETKLYIFCPQSLIQKTSYATDATQQKMLCNCIAMHLRQFFTFLFSSAGYPGYATDSCKCLES